MQKLAGAVMPNPDDCGGFRKQARRLRDTQLTQIAELNYAAVLVRKFLESLVQTRGFFMVQTLRLWRKTRIRDAGRAQIVERAQASHVRRSS